MKKLYFLQVHRPSHFLNFAALEEGTEWNGSDREDLFAWKRKKGIFFKFNHQILFSFIRISIVQKN